jgi:hypothetical protein
MSERHPSGVHDFGDEFKRRPIADADLLFAYFIRTVIAILLLYGLGMMLCVLFGDEKLAAKLLNGFTGMFAGVIGLGSGYLLGKRNGNGGKT